MILLAELWEKRAREELVFSRTLMFMPSYSHLALSSAQGNEVKYWHRVIMEIFPQELFF